jgi:uncharacterized Zn finger protein (UPF0148 family)
VIQGQATAFWVRRKAGFQRCATCGAWFEEETRGAVWCPACSASHEIEDRARREAAERVRLPDVEPRP